LKNRLVDGNTLDVKKNLTLLAKVKIANPTDISKCEEVELVIDTGATFTVISKNKLHKLGIAPLYKKRLKLRDGTVIERGWHNLL
jgi:predicted aspartyl protease